MGGPAKACGRAHANLPQVLTCGPRVNRARPAIDLAMRSAAAHYGARAVGVVLSGMLDDGAAGLRAIERGGGETIVQHPAEALFPSMPERALARVAQAEMMPVTAIAPLLNRLARTPAPEGAPVPRDIILENRLDMGMMNEMEEMDGLGKQVPVSCPECNGPMWEVADGGPPRYRCHVGHGLSVQTMLAAQGEALEQSLWVALRTLEEKGRVLARMAAHEAERDRQQTAAAYQADAAEVEAHAGRLRELLLQLVEEEVAPAGAGPAADSRPSPGG